MRSQWRYAKALPLELTPVSLGEGCTPLLPLTIDGLDLAVKPEWFNPTASFKDRAIGVLVFLAGAVVFGAGALSTGGASGIALTAAISLALVAIAPFAGGAAVRAAREG